MDIAVPGLDSARKVLRIIFPAGSGKAVVAWVAPVPGAIQLSVVRPARVAAQRDAPHFGPAAAALLHAMRSGKGIILVARWALVIAE